MKIIEHTNRRHYDAVVKDITQFLSKGYDPLGFGSDALEYMHAVLANRRPDVKLKTLWVALGAVDPAQNQWQDRVKEFPRIIRNSSILAIAPQSQGLRMVEDIVSDIKKTNISRQLTIIARALNRIELEVADIDDRLKSILVESKELSNKRDVLVDNLQHLRRAEQILAGD